MEKWILKLIGLALLGLFGYVFYSEGLPAVLGEPADVQVCAAGLLTALLGVLLAMRWQFHGGILIFVGMIPFYVTGLSYRLGWFFYVLAVMGALHMLFGVFERLAPKGKKK